MASASISSVGQSSREVPVVPNVSSQLSAVVPHSESSVGPGPRSDRFKINELLAYAQFYRNQSNSANIHKLIVTFFHANEIAEAKRCLIAEFDEYLLDCSYKVTRRHSQARSAHDAEVEDILAIFDNLDNRDILKEVQFVAAQLDRLPKYGPTEINLCYIADRQSRFENDFQCMTTVIDELKSEVQQSACLNAITDLSTQTQ